MKKNIIEQVINSGVPIATPILISYSDLYNLCKNKKKFSDFLNHEFSKAYQFIFGNSNVGEIQLFQTMTVTTDKDTLDKKICFSFFAIISSLCINLNIDNMYYKIMNCTKNMQYSEYNLDSFEDKMGVRINYLESIKKEKVLKREFPVLYQIYLGRVKQAQAFIQFEKMLEQNKDDVIKELQIRKMIIETIEKYSIDKKINLEQEIEKAKNFSLKSFCNDCAIAFEYVQKRLPEIKNYLLIHPIDFSQFSQFDIEKLDLYIATQFLITAEVVKLEEKQRYLYHVTNYFLTNENRKNNADIEITYGIVENEQLDVNIKGNKITPKKLYDRYKKLLVENPTLHAIDFRNVSFSNMNLIQVEEYLEEFMKELSANWEFLPKDNKEIENKLLDNIQSTHKRIQGECENGDKIEYEHLLDLYMKKKEFYDSTDPFFRIKGKNTFDGYIGYIYSNGKVILEKYYENSITGRLAYGEAGYSMDIVDFYKLSKLSKLELMNMDDNICQRIVHRGNWQKIAQSIIEQDGNFFNTANEVKKLIKSKNVNKIDN